jgi:hypothetical protein
MNCGVSLSTLAYPRFLRARCCLFVGRCAGSRRPDHARRPFLCDRDGMPTRTHVAQSLRFVCRSTVECTPTQPHSSIWPRTTFSMGGQEAGQERGRRRQRISHATCDVRARLAQMRLRLGAHRAAGSQHPFCQHCCQHVATALPCHTCASHAPPSTILHPAVLGSRPLYALCTGRLAVSARLGRPAALLAFVVRDAQGLH